jgi:acyl carrier protein
LDEQIKVRGYRIEPGEIEAVMQRHPAIRSSIVIAATSDSGDTSLVGYVVTIPDVPVSSSDLRVLLSSYLPDHMVPAKFVKIDELPFTANGKIDRSSLPLPSPDNILAEDHFDPPQSDTESWLANFLVKMLGVPRISRNDNFFRLGGHSLLGAQLIARIQQKFGVELSLRTLFDHPTVSGIASEIAVAIHAKLDAMSEDEVRATLESLPGEIAV